MLFCVTSERTSTQQTLSCSLSPAVALPLCCSSSFPLPSPPESVSFSIFLTPCRALSRSRSRAPTVSSSQTQQARRRRAPSSHGTNAPTRNETAHFSRRLHLLDCLRLRAVPWSVHQRASLPPSAAAPAPAPRCRRARSQMPARGGGKLHSHTQCLRLLRQPSSRPLASWARR